MTTVARRLARCVVGLTLDAIPEPVVGKGVDLVLDTLGNALAAARDDFGVAVLDVARSLGGPAESSLLGAPGKVAAANAVLANATLAHGLDFDDTREDAIVHTSCVAVPTALAVGEATGATGREALKPYPCGSIAQPYMDCAVRLREARGVRADAITAILCRTSAGPVPRLWEPLAAKHAPPNGYAAKFSLPYLVASILVRGKAGLAEFTDEAAHDPDVLRVA